MTGVGRGWMTLVPFGAFKELGVWCEIPLVSELAALFVRYHFWLERYDDSKEGMDGSWKCRQMIGDMNRFDQIFASAAQQVNVVIWSA